MTVLPPSKDILLENMRQAKSQVLAGLRERYGDYYFDRIFLARSKNTSVSRGLLAFSSATGASGTRLKRKMGIRILQALQNKREEAFVWATGGHSAAAGHGNLLRESYTAVLTETVTPVFRAAGLRFEGRNYAIGGMSSGPEIAFCVESIFGSDMDVLVWDYGMTDGSAVDQLALYGYRAGMQASRPALVAMNVGGGSIQKRRIRVLKELEKMGLTALYLNDKVVQDVFDSIPDMAGMTRDEMLEVPYPLRFFKCNKKLESGEPGCGEMKFNSSHCPDRKGRTKWHPGHKWHATIGVLLSLFLLEVLEAAVLEVSESINHPALLQKLRSLEDSDYDSLSAGLPSLYRSYSQKKGLSNEEASRLLRRPNVCRTALRPSQSRYHGLNTVTGIMDEMTITQAPEEVCDVPLRIDYKDYYEVSSEGKLLVLPSDQERRNYGPGSLWGVLVVCFQKCDFGTCPEGFVGAKDFQDLEMTVNGDPVVKLDLLNDECGVLRGSKDRWKLDDNKSYTLRARVLRDGGHARISSMIAW